MMCEMEVTIPVVSPSLSLMTTGSYPVEGSSRNIYSFSKINLKHKKPEVKQLRVISSYLQMPLSRFGQSGIVGTNPNGSPIPAHISHICFCFHRKYISLMILFCINSYSVLYQLFLLFSRSI